MRDGPQIEPGYSGEITRVAGEERQVGADRYRGDQRVVGAGSGFAPGPTEICGDTTEGPGSGRIERQCVEVGLGHLEMRLPISSLVRIFRCQRTDGKLGKSNGADHWFVGKH